MCVRHDARVQATLLNMFYAVLQRNFLKQKKEEYYNSFLKLSFDIKEDSLVYFIFLVYADIFR